MLLSTVLLGAWWLCYRMALRQERSFAYNRAFLVLGPLLAAGLPLLPIAWPANWGAAPAALPGMAVLLPAMQVGPAVSSAEAALSWPFWLSIAYVVGVLFVLVRLGFGLIGLWRSTRALPREPHTDYTLVLTHGQLPTSSFGRVVFWDETLPLSAAEARQVLRHELAHVRQGHTYDRLLLELLRAGLWFNPFVHLCGRALGLTHEFLADEAALREAETSSAPTDSYAHLLARQVATRLGFSVPLAHSFSYSQTLSRIAMIKKINPIRRWKQGLALPLLVALLVTVAACEREAVSPVDTHIPPVQPEAPRLASDSQPSADKVYTYVEQMPQLPGGGGNRAIVEYIQQHLTYPDVASDARRSGRIFVQFVVTSQGEVSNVKVVKGLGPEYDAAVVAAVQQLPRFTPGSQAGTPVSVSYTVPVMFASDASK